MSLLVSLILVLLTSLILGLIGAVVYAYNHRAAIYRGKRLLGDELDKPYYYDIGMAVNLKTGKLEEVRIRKQ